MNTTTDTKRVTLDIEGMTCASCAMRIEKKLNKLDGVEATVNFALEQASVTAPEGVSVDDLVAQVEAAGYGVRAPAADGDGGHDPDAADIGNACRAGLTGLHWCTDCADGHGRNEHNADCDHGVCAG